MSKSTASQPIIPSVRGTALRFLADAQRTNGGWTYRADLADESLEPTIWSLLALGAWDRLEPHLEKRGLDFLIRTQRADGGFGRMPSQDAPSDWHTFPAMLCLRQLSGRSDTLQRAVDWTLAARAKHWKNPDPANLGHDTSLEGWSWVAGTHAWAEPTAYALMALEACGHADHPRAVEARTMLVDRAVAGGGWNYGNKMVLGTNLRPFPGTTGIVLTALRHRTEEPSVQAGIRYLQQQIRTVRSAMSLAWTIIALKLLAPDTFDAAGQTRVDEVTDAALTHTMNTSGNAHHLALVLLSTQQPERWPFNRQPAGANA